MYTYIFIHIYTHIYAYKYIFIYNFFLNIIILEFVGVHVLTNKTKVLLVATKLSYVAAHNDHASDKHPVVGTDLKMILLQV